MITIFGIKNCDTIKKTLKWFEMNTIPYTFHDYRKDGLDKAWLLSAVAELGWENVLNKRGTTFRQLPDSAKQDLNEQNAVALLLEHPAMIKRPIVQHGQQFLLGFKESALAAFCHSGNAHD